MDQVSHCDCKGEEETRRRKEEKNLQDSPTSEILMATAKNYFAGAPLSCFLSYRPAKGPPLLDLYVMR